MNRYLNKKYQLIFLLSFFIVILAGIKLIYKPDWSQIEPIKIVVNLTPTPTPNIVKENNIKDDYPLIGILPYIGKTFDIEQYKEPLTLLVKVKSKDINAIEKEMTELFKEQGVNIDSHKFDWKN